MAKSWHQGLGITRFSPMQWYYSKTNTQLGPVSDQELRQKLATGEVFSTDMVWREGMIDWQAVALIDELRLVPPTPSTGLPPLATAAEASPYAPPAVPSGLPGYVPTSGLAVVSLVCGILALITCMFLAGIPAVICGHLALTQMANPSIRMSGRGMAIAGLIMGYLAIATTVGMILMMVAGLVAGAIN
jgi:hypothetical protein